MLGASVEVTVEGIKTVTGRPRKRFQIVADVIRSTLPTNKTVSRLALDYLNEGTGP